jgi:hypothetical protein
VKILLFWICFWEIWEGVVGGGWFVGWWLGWVSGGKSNSNDGVQQSKIKFIQLLNGLSVVMRCLGRMVSGLWSEFWYIGRNIVFGAFLNGNN